MEERVEFRAALDDQGRRLDRVLRKMLPGLGLSGIYRLIRTGLVRLNGRPAAPDNRLQSGDAISLPRAVLAKAAGARKPGGSARAAGGPAAPASRPRAGRGRFASEAPPSLEALRPLILLETPHLLALNKPRGWLVHGPGSLEDPVRRYLAGRPAAGGPAAESSGSLSFRPGPVHRLDRNTSGLLLFAASLFAATTLSALFRAGRVDKRYLAVLDGTIDRPARWTDELARDPLLLRSYRAAGGKPAVTEVSPVLTRGGLTLAACRMRSGRTHQIRAQAALAGHPLAGDRKYGGSGRLPAYLLHAAFLRLDEEVPGLGFRELEAPLFAADLARLESLFGGRAASRVRETLERWKD